MSLPTPKPGVMQIEPYKPGKSKASGSTSQIIKLSSNENTLGPSPKAIAAYKAHADQLYRYPDGAATMLREAIGQVHDIPADNIVCGAGSDELIGLLIQAYAGIGDEVLYSEFGFLMYKIYALGKGATPVTAPEKRFTANVDALLAQVTERTRILFIANPNNPTGTYLPATELKRLRDGLPEQVILAIDGAYTEYVDKADYSSGRELVEAGNNTVMLRTFSKIYGLSSLRLGWGYFPAPIADAMNRVRGPFNVSGAAIAAGTAAMEDVDYTQKMRDHNTKWLAWTRKEIEALGLTVYPSIANFIMIRFPDSGKTSAEANKFLMEKGIILREIAAYGLPDCLRMTIGTEEENRAAVDALTAFMQS